MFCCSSDSAIGLDFSMTACSMSKVKDYWNTNREQIKSLLLDVMVILGDLYSKFNCHFGQCKVDLKFGTELSGLVME